MLAQPYQDYIRAMVAVAGAEVKATGKFKAGTIKKHSSVAAAAQAAYDHTMANASVKPAESAKYINGEMAKATLARIKKVHKALKKQGLVLLPAAAVPGVAVAQATDATSSIDRRAFLKGATSAAAVIAVGGVMLTPTQAQAGDKAYWSAVKKEMNAFLATMDGEIQAAMVN